MAAKSKDQEDEIQTVETRNAADAARQAAEEAAADAAAKAAGERQCECTRDNGTRVNGTCVRCGLRK